MPHNHRTEFTKKRHCPSGQKDRFGRCIDRPFTPQSRPGPKPPGPKPPPKPDPFKIPKYSPFSMPYSSHEGEDIALGAGIGAVAGAGLGAAGMGLGRALSSTAGYARLASSDIEMGIPRAGTVAEEVANPRGYYTSSRIVERPNIRFRGIPQEEDEFGEEGLEDEAKAAQSISQKVMQNA